MRLLIIPVSCWDENEIADVISKLSEVFFLNNISVEQPAQAPIGLFDEVRNQYDAESLLHFFSRVKKGSDEVILIITDVDLYVPGLNFVFGLANNQIGAIISLRRLRQEFYGLKPDRKLFMERTLKEVIHELGHVMGLGHCLNQRCVMHFSNSIIDTDIKDHRFCPACKEKLTRTLRKVAGSSLS